MQYFNSLNGLYHYVICPEDDYFVTNTLEMLDFHEYFYRTLKEKGYKRIIFFDYAPASHQFKILTFDKFSYGSFFKPEAFEKLKDGDTEALSRAYADIDNTGSANTQIVKDTRPKTSLLPENDYGRTMSNNNVSGDKLAKLMCGNVIECLKSSIKTAIVMPVALMDTISNERLGNVIQTFSDAYATRAMSNIMVFTMPERGNVTKLCRYQDMLRGFASVYGEQTKDWVNSNIDQLKASNLLLEAAPVGEDEVINLLLRKKVVEGDARFSKLPFSKIGTIAQMILRQCTQNGYAPFKHLASVSAPEQARHFSTMKFINASLSEDVVSDAFIAELVEKAGKVKSEEVQKNLALCALEVQRINRVGVTRFTNSENVESILSELDQLVGMQGIKKQLLKFLTQFKKKRSDYLAALEAGKAVQFPYMNMVFEGPPGTGKSTVGSIIARLLSAMNILNKNEPMVFNASDVNSGGYVGVLGDKLRAKLNEGVGGVIMIDEAYHFNAPYGSGENAGNIGAEALAAIMNVADANKENVCIILAGYENDMKKLLGLNQGAERRFPYTIKFKPYSTEDLMEIFRRGIAREGMTATAEALSAVEKVISAIKGQRDQKFGNAGFLSDELIPKLEAEYTNRGGADNIYTEADVIAAFPELSSILTSKKENTCAILAELDKFVGMDYVKESLLDTLAFFKEERARYFAKLKRGEDPGEYPYMNFVFNGLPGVGKTTIAKIIARLFVAEGVLSRPEPLIFRAGDIHTGGHADVLADILEAKLKEGLGGVVVIDEFYDFNRPHSAGNSAEEAFRAIMGVTDTNKDNICIILAGYPNQMNEMFSRFNMGAKRRFPHSVDFRPYTADELVEIAKLMAAKRDASFSPEALTEIRRVIEFTQKKEGDRFGNAGFVSDQLLVHIATQYRKRGATDGVYTEADVIAAFPECFRAEEKHEKFTVTADMFKALPSIYTRGDETYSKGKLARATDPAILFVESCGRGFGTAFLISPEGYALTCNHVIENATEIKARLRVPGRIGGDDSWHKCTVVKADPALDMALIKLEGSNFPYIPIATPDRVIHKCEEFILSGYPFGERTKEDITTFSGSIGSTGKHTSGSGITYYNINSEAKQGDSGAPIIAIDDGKVIGILCGSHTSGTGGNLVEEINYMRPISYFWENFTE